MVIEKTSPVMAIIAVVTEDKKLRAESGPPGNNSVLWIPSSRCGRPTATRTDAVTHAAGISQNACRARRPKVRSRQQPQELHLERHRTDRTVHAVRQPPL